MPTIHITLLGRFAVTVDGVPVAESNWTRRHAAALVKVLALAPGRRLHREQIIDLVWPDDTIDEAAPKLHKAAHFARRAIDVPNSVVLRGDNVVLCPDADTTVDVVQFEELARRALADEDVAAAREALAIYGGELLPAGPLRGVGRGAPRAAPAPPPRPAAPRRSLGDGGRARRRATSSPISRSCGATPRTAIATPRCVSSNAWTARCAASSASLPAARRWRSATACSPSTTSCRAATTR